MMEDRHLYKAWHTRLKQIYDAYKIDFDEGLVYCLSSKATTHTFGMIDIILIQSTGLRDKNDKLIFEGDLLSPGWGKGELLQIVWDKRKARFAEKRVGREDVNKLTLILDGSLMYSEINPVEIIGNIYQDAHLLEDKG